MVRTSEHQIDFMFRAFGSNIKRKSNHNCLPNVTVMQYSCLPTMCEVYYLAYKSAVIIVF